MPEMRCESVFQSVIFLVDLSYECCISYVISYVDTWLVWTVFIFYSKWWKI